MSLPLPIYRWQRLFFSELVFVILTGSQVLLFCYSPDGRAAAISAVIGAFQRDPKDNNLFLVFHVLCRFSFFFFSYLWFGQSTTAVVSLNLSTTNSFLRYIFKLSITMSSCELSFFWFCKLHGTIFHYFILKLLWNLMPGSLKLFNHFFHRLQNEDKSGPKFGDNWPQGKVLIKNGATT